VWREADDIDTFESAWNFDHFYPIFSDSTGPCMEAWVTLTALAQATSRIRVGTMVNGILYRHPAVLANMAATLDIVSGGRLDLGLGAGWNDEECTAYGIELGTLTERFDRFDEAVQIIIGMLSDTETTFDGRYFKVTEARNEPKGPQRPHPPICIGGTGPKRTLRSVARWAQHWNHPAGTPDDIRRALEILDGHCADIGRDRSEILISTQVRFDPTESLDKAVEEWGALADVGVELGVIYLPTPHDPALLSPLAEAIAPLT
jgi:F420-dependent oxidoreductase-like protein